MRTFLSALAVSLVPAAAMANGQPGTFSVTIEPAPPLQAVPSGRVDKGALDLIPGTVESASRPPPPAYAPSYGGRFPSAPEVPIPEPSPMSVSYCEMDLGG